MRVYKTYQLYTCLYPPTDNSLVPLSTDYILLDAPVKPILFLTLVEFVVDAATSTSTTTTRNDVFHRNRFFLAQTAAPANYHVWPVFRRNFHNIIYDAFIISYISRWYHIQENLTEFSSIYYKSAYTKKRNKFLQKQLDTVAYTCEEVVVPFPLPELLVYL